MIDTISECPIRGVVEGIDVSEYQPSIDWHAVASSGRRFAYLRESIGNTRDSAFLRHLDGARGAALLVGGYHYAVYSSDPRETAHRFSTRLEKYRCLDLPPVVDLESTGKDPDGGLGTWVDKFVDVVICVTGIRPIIYTGSYYADARLSVGDYRASPPYWLATVWLAQYGTSKPVWSRPHGTEIVLWQYAGNTIRSDMGAVVARGGRCPGVTGECDLDAFLGSYDGLRQLTEECRVKRWTDDPSPWAWSIDADMGKSP